jgi:CheY-like chemotaxis protein
VLPADHVPLNAEPELLIVEDNAGFSTVLQNLATEFGFKAVCVHNAADAYRYIEARVPASIILDLGLPDAPGEQLLDFIKSQPRTSKVPVHVISGNPDVIPTTLHGAQEFIAKPFGRERLDQLYQDISGELHAAAVQRVLVIEDDPVQCEAIEETFKERQIPCDMVHSGADARQRLADRHYGAVVVDLDLPDCDGFALVEEIRQLTQSLATPIIVYTARDLTKKQDADLRRHATRIVLKTDRSINRLMNETTLFLHWLQGNEPNKLPSSVTAHEKTEPVGQRILVVDDDIRNLYSLSAVLEDCGWEVRTAGNGREALDVLADEGAFDLVLMDIMMPEMDGFEAMQRIRAQEAFTKMPIIALTAKAMRDDRARCIEAGANDYVSKPVDNNKLKAIVKMWLGQT